MVVVEGRGVFHREEKHLLQVFLLKHLELLKGGKWGGGGLKDCSSSMETFQRIRNIHTYVVQHKQLFILHYYSFTTWPSPPLPIYPPSLSLPPSLPFLLCTWNASFILPCVSMTSLQCWDTASLCSSPEEDGEGMVSCVYVHVYEYVFVRVHAQAYIVDVYVCVCAWEREQLTGILKFNISFLGPFFQLQWHTYVCTYKHTWYVYGHPCTQQTNTLLHHACKEQPTMLNHSTCAPYLILCLRRC